MNKKYLRIGLIVLFVGAIALLLLNFDIRPYLSVEALQNQVNMLGPLGPVFFMALYAVATIFFLPASPLSVAAGALFGPILGTIYTVVGATIGAIVAFLLARYLGRDFVEGFLKNRLDKIFEYDKKLQEKGFSVVLFLRLLPIFPFNGLNFALGLTKVSFRDYALGTFLGIIPGAFAFVYFGNSLASLSVPQIALATVILFALLFGPSLYKKYRAKQGKEAIPVKDNDQNEKES